MFQKSEVFGTANLKSVPKSSVSGTVAVNHSFRQNPPGHLLHAGARKGQKGEFTARNECLLRHYRMDGQKIQAGRANENGDVEQRHHRLKRAIDQALMLPDSRDFASLAEYKQFLRLLLAQLHAGVGTA